MQRPAWFLQRSLVLRLALAVAVLVASLALVLGPVARADEYCDTSEAVACIPMPDDSGSAAAGAPTGQNGAAVSGAPQIAAIAVPCPLQGSASGSSASGINAPSAVAVPVPICPPGGGCGPQPLGVAAPAQASPSVPIPVPAPLPVLCSPYRGIYATINLGNAADARALRTLSTLGLRSYWRQSALQQLEDQVSQLQAADMYATARLYSIQVLDSNVDYVAQTATVHTMEHWLYQERSSDDGSIVLSQDEWVRNEYDLNLFGSTWYITGNSTSLQQGPVPVPATGG